MRPIRAYPPVERVRDLFTYEPDTGSLRWRTGSPKRTAGAIAGTQNGAHGYRCVQVDGRSCQVHRLIWGIVYGEYPDTVIDHINGVRDDNRIKNLRLATESENHANSKLYSTNTSGFKGVRRTRFGRWQARIWIDHTEIHLGNFDTPEQAAERYMAAARNAFGDFARAQ